MAELTQQEAIGLVGTAFEVPALPTAPSNIAKAAGETFRAGNADSALRIVSGDIVPHSKKDVEGTLLTNLSSERDPTTGEKILPTKTIERGRLSKAKTVADRVRDYIETGSSDLRKQIADYLRNNSPIFRDILYDSSSPGGTRLSEIESNALIERIMKDPGFRDALRKSFSETLDPKKKLGQEEEVQRLSLELSTLESQLAGQVSPADFQAAKDRVNQAVTNLTALEPVQLTLKSREQRFLQVAAGLPRARSEAARLLADPNLSLLVTEIDAKNSALSAMIANNSGDPNIPILRSEIQNLQSNPDYQAYMPHKNLIDEEQNLSTEITTLRGQTTPVEQEYENAKEELKTLNERSRAAASPQERMKIEAQIQQKRIELADARTLLEGEMIQFYRDVTHMPEDAVEAYMNETFGKLKTLYQESDQAEAEKQKTEKDVEVTRAESAATKVARLLWKKDNPGTRKGVEYGRIDPTKVREYLQEYLSRGSEGLLLKIFDEVQLLTPTANNPLGGLTPSEKDAFLTKIAQGGGDPEFRSKIGKMLGAEVLSDYFLAGGRLNRDMVLSIVTSPGGQELLAEAQTRRATIEKTLTETERGILGNLDKLKGNRTNAEFLKANWWKFGLGLILLLILLLGGKAAAMSGGLISQG